jgi:hypothetical protein
MRTGIGLRVPGSDRGPFTARAVTWGILTCLLMLTAACGQSGPDGSHDAVGRLTYFLNRVCIPLMVGHEPFADLIAREQLVEQSRCGFPQSCAKVRCSPNSALGCASVEQASCSVSSLSSDSTRLQNVVNASITPDRGWRRIEVPDEDERFAYHCYKDNRVSELTFIDSSHFEVTFREQPRLCSGR